MFLVIGIFWITFGCFPLFMPREFFDSTWGRLRYAPDEPPKWWRICARTLGAAMIFIGIVFLAIQWM